MAASSLYRNKSVLGSHLRKMKARMGSVEAITATAHKMARILYSMMQNKTDYKEEGGDYYDQMAKQKTLKYLRKWADALGYKLEIKDSQVVNS
jgi:hypothetical protein